MSQRLRPLFDRFYRRPQVKSRVTAVSERFGALACANSDCIAGLWSVLFFFPLLFFFFPLLFFFFHFSLGKSSDLVEPV